MADKWVTDDVLYDAAERCAKKMIEMYHDWIGNPYKHPKGPGNLPTTIIDSVRLDAEDFMFYDPGKLVEEYDRMVRLGKAIGTNPELAADFGETRKLLAHWSGDVAIAFGRQLDKMEEYCDLQHTNIGLALQGLLAAGQLAIHARADYLELAEATIAAADREIGEQAKRATTAFVSIASEVVTSVLEMDVKSLVTGAISLTIKVGSGVFEHVIEGDDADVVIGNYLRARDMMRTRYDGAFNQLREDFLNKRIDEALREGQPLKEPMPACCYVDGPNFNYEEMQSTRAGAAAPSTSMVEEERQKYVEDKKREQQRDSEIDRRLNHGDKGAI